MSALWRIVLFDGPRLLGTEGSEIRRLRSQRVGALLAYLALHLGRDCPRDEVAEALWPDEDPLVTANRLRVALTSLRRQLEPPGIAAGSVLDTRRPGYLRLRSETVWCDVVAFDAALKRGDSDTAAQLATGPLLPGFYDDWIIARREQLAAQQETLPAPRPAPAAPDVSVPLPRLPRRVPLYLTSFVGRDTERDSLVGQLTQSPARLVTLTGLGGTGKTRLSVEAARALPDDTAVWFVPLADLWQGEHLAEAIRTALGLPVAGAPLPQLVEYLEQFEKPVLVLDNLEQIVLRAAPFLDTLLGRVPTLRLLVTSRCRLELPGEVEVVVTPLPVPAREHPEPLVALAQNPAVRLFWDRARQVRPDFALTENNQGAITALCQLLEGIPLGLELAASRTALLTPAQILERLRQHWDALEASDRGGGKQTARHRSLRAVVEWSVALLPPDARRLFIRLACFAGGATVDAVEEVCDAPFALDTLTRLRACSLLTLTEQEGTVRIVVLEVLRQWAQEQLPPDERTVLGERHAAWFAGLVARAFPEAGLATERPWADRLETELANIRQALQHTRDSDPERLATFAEQLAWFWEVRGYAPEGQGYLEAARQHQASPASAVALAQLLTFQGALPEAQALAEDALTSATDPRIRALLLHARAFAAFRRGLLAEALESVESGLALLDEAAFPLDATRFWSTRGAILRDLSRFDEAQVAMERSITLGRACGAGRVLAGALNNLAALRYILKQDGAEALFDEARALYSELGARSGVAVIHMNRAVMAARRDAWDDAREQIAAAIMLLRQTGHRRHLASALSTLGQVLTRLDELPGARRALHEAFTLRRALGNPHSLYVTGSEIAAYALRCGQPETAARLLGGAYRYLDDFGQPLPPDEQEEHAALVAAIQAALPMATFERAVAAGRQLDPTAYHAQIDALLTAVH